MKSKKIVLPFVCMFMMVLLSACILIAYFSRVGNTDFADDVDAVTSASLLVKDNRIYGNTQYVATLVQKAAGGDLFLIETKEKYPSDYDETWFTLKTDAC